MPLNPRYKVVTPRKDLREDRLLDALVDTSTDEKRWGDGVLARENGLGL
jgi:hypothetical protein